MTLGLGLLPIVPILLLPFIIVLFVIVFPLWVVALGVVGAVLVIVRGLDWLTQRAGTRALSGVANAVGGAFQWVLTFGGLARKAQAQLQPQQPATQAPASQSKPAA